MINLHTPIQIQKSTSAALLMESKISNVRKKTLSKKIELGMNSLVVLIGIFIAFIMLAFLIHSNKTATTGYQLKGLEQELNALVIENEVNNMKIAKMISLENILNDPQVVKMMPPAGERQFIGEFTIVASR